MSRLMYQLRNVTERRIDDQTGAPIEKLECGHELRQPILNTDAPPRRRCPKCPTVECPTPISHTPRVGDTTVAENWDGEKWIERKLTWDGERYVLPGRES